MLSVTLGDCVPRCGAGNGDGWARVRSTEMGELALVSV